MEEIKIEGRYADVMLDSTFKRCFKEYGSANKLMLLFLQAAIPDRKIVSIEYTSEESTNQHEDGKSIRVDVECVDDNGERFMVELQRARQDFFYERALFNSTFAIQRQLKIGDDRYRLKPVYFIGLLRFSMNPDEEQVFYHYLLKEKNTDKVMTDNLNYIFLETPKCHLHEKASTIEKIGYALQHLQEFDDRPQELDGEFFDILFSSAELTKFAPEEKFKYLHDMTTDRDIRNQIAYARNEGRDEGRAEGESAGIEKGRAF